MKKIRDFYLVGFIGWPQESPATTIRPDGFLCTREDHRVVFTTIKVFEIKTNILFEWVGTKAAEG